MEKLSALEFFENVKVYQNNIHDNFEQPSMIITKLLKSQRRVVNWMIDRENHNELVKSDGSPFSGGILADDKGLGKTIEILSCIIANPSPSEFYKKKFLNAVSKNDSQNTFISVTPNPSTNKDISCTSEVESTMDDDYLTVKCHCINTPSESTLVVCAVCGNSQHAACVNFEPRPFQEVPYLCADCWVLNDKIQCKATLIVVQQFELDQWIIEIDKHIAKPGLKVLVYNGVHLDGYIQPIAFNDYDIVITTYDWLFKDLSNYVGRFGLKRQNKNCHLQYSKKYSSYPQSPLPCITWWRICFDDCEEIKVGTVKVSKMSSCLKSIHKWAISGTPIKKSLYDLYKVFKLIDIGRFCNRTNFNMVMKSQTSSENFKWFSMVIWKNFLHDVNSEFSLPKLTYENHWLTFSEIEKYFYLCHHNENALAFSNNLNKLFPGLDIPLKLIDIPTIDKAFKPLCILKRVCLHPQTLNEQCLKVNQMTMAKAMDVIIESCGMTCSHMLHTIVSQHISIAALCRLCLESATAVEHYRNILSLMELFRENKIEIDRIQMIHVMYNLAKVLNNYSTEVSHALSDSDLKNNMECLENEYLDASKKKVELAFKTLQLNSDKVAEHIHKRTLNYSNWWSDLLLKTDGYFLINIRIQFKDYCAPSVPDISNDLKSVNDMHEILSVWIDKLDSVRIETISKVRILEKTSISDLAHSAKECSLGCSMIMYKKDNSSYRVCLLCKAKCQLLVYQSLLFSVYPNESNIPNDTIYGIMDRCETSNSLWKMSQKEFLLIKLFQYGQAKKIDNKCLEDASEHLMVLELIRKECINLWLLWKTSHNSLSDLNDIANAKQELSWDYESLSRADVIAYSPDEKKTNRDNIELMEQCVTQSESKLKEAIGKLLYIKRLKNSPETEPCFICYMNVGSGWAVLQCGHSVCSRCFVTLCKHAVKNMHLTCPKCRELIPMNHISYVKSNREIVEDTVPINGSFSTKIKNVTMKLMELVAQDPKVKVLIFSSWAMSLNILGEAFELNSVNYRILKLGHVSKKTLNEFKINEKINALLMPLDLGSEVRGLNLTEATRVFFLEPDTSKTDQYQAICRMYRLGQTKPTFVHYFIMRDSVEENITNMLSSDPHVPWADMTLSQILTVFKRSEPDQRYTISPQ